MFVCLVPVLTHVFYVCPSGACVLTHNEDGSTAGAASAKVSFHAQLSSNEGVRSGHTLVLSTVYNNDGHAYSNITGCFSAPFDGTYFFIASAGGDDDDGADGADGANVVGDYDGGGNNEEDIEG